MLHTLVNGKSNSALPRPPLGISAKPAPASYTPAACTGPAIGATTAVTLINMNRRDDATSEAYGAPVERTQAILGENGQGRQTAASRKKELRKALCLARRM